MKGEDLQEKNKERKNEHFQFDNAQQIDGMQDSLANQLAPLWSEKTQKRK